VAGIREKRNIQRTMTGKTEGERLLPRSRGKREDKNKFIFWTWGLCCGVDLSSDMENWQE